MTKSGSSSSIPIFLNVDPFRAYIYVYIYMYMYNRTVIWEVDCEVWLSSKGEIALRM